MGLFRGQNRRALGALMCLSIVAATAGVFALWARRAPAVGPLDGAIAAYGRGDWTAAERKARELIRKNGETPTALRLIARALYRTGHLTRNGVPRGGSCGGVNHRPKRGTAIDIRVERPEQG